MAYLEIKKKKKDGEYSPLIRNIDQQEAQSQNIIMLESYAPKQFGKRYEASGTVETFLGQLVTMEIKAKVNKMLTGKNQRELLVA